MITDNALVIYKGKPAVVKDRADGKFTISLNDGDQVKVRDKDIELIHPGPVKNFSDINNSNISQAKVREAWELLADEGADQSLKNFCEFVFNEYTPSSAYAAFCLLRDGLYFYGDINAIKPRSKEDVILEETKRDEKQRETGERSQFIERLKACIKKPDENKMLSDDIRFMQDVEALSFGKSAKSRTLKDVGLSETPEDAHSLLLKTGFWTETVNPYPSRYGLTLNSAKYSDILDVSADALPAILTAQDSSDERRDLCHLTAFAIDSPWSTDPDDAVSIEAADAGQSILYVHVADPAAFIAFESVIEKEARDRGVTLYLPEGAVRMLAEEYIDLLALGLSEKSYVLTFKLTVDEGGAVVDTEIFPSVVKVRRMTYEQADNEMDSACDDAAALKALYNLSQKIYSRRTAHGAVNIELPDIHIAVKDGDVTIEPINEYKSSFLIKECMIATGEGAGTWAASRGLAFPYISQEVELQPDHSTMTKRGYAGSLQLRKCMRPRVLSTKPGRHQGLGLDTYTQVTSPLRRYTDLLAHIQIRAFLRDQKVLNADEISSRLGFSEAGAAAAVHAERASQNHWKMVYLQRSFQYLSDKKKSVWDAVAAENKGSRWVVIIPALALETQVALQKDTAPNDEVKLILKSVNIAKGEAVFSVN